MFTPNKQQAIGLKKAKEWYLTRSKPTFEISGIAGSGKTTLVYYIIQELGLSMDEVVFAAYIGKATLAMVRKGTPATTIHHLIYDVIEVVKKDENGNAIIDPSTNRAYTVPKFVKKEALAPNIKLIVIDEGAMVSTPIAMDLLSFGIPIIVLGDRRQLPPVFGKPYFLRYPDVELNEPMRQALDSPIIYLAQKAIYGEAIRIGNYGDGTKVIYKEDMSDEMLLKSDITICHRNLTREDINNYVRKSILSRPDDRPVVNDKIICRQNNWQKYINNDIFLINGLIGYVERVDLASYNKNSIKIDFRPEFLKYDMFHNLEIDYKYLCAPQEVKATMSRSYYNKFEYAYAITCHLAQGSEYEDVLVFNEPIFDKSLYNKWLYTAITRSSKNLIIAI
jgi:exodeoxyribonuclease-5